LLAAAAGVDMATKPRANTAAADATVVFKSCLIFSLSLSVSGILALVQLVGFWRWFSPAAHMGCRGSVRHRHKENVRRDSSLQLFDAEMQWKDDHHSIGNARSSCHGHVIVIH
jgi:hypothetical protein